MALGISKIDLLDAFMSHCKNSECIQQSIIWLQVDNICYLFYSDHEGGNVSAHTAHLVSLDWSGDFSNKLTLTLLLVSVQCFCTSENLPVYLDSLVVA